jgi:hypothetical protein
MIDGVFPTRAKESKMVVMNKRGSVFGQSHQERLAKDDIRLLLELIIIARRNETIVGTSDTRLELLIGKLKRMEKQ